MSNNDSNIKDNESIEEPPQTLPKQLDGPKRKGRKASTDSQSRRKENNKLSARQSRLRKKQYIEEIKDRCKILETDNVRLRTINQNLKEKQRLSAFTNLYSIDDYLSGRNELYEKLEQMIKQGASKAEMDAIIECLKTRTGAYGTQRK
jgi:hypothetical protein